MSSTTLLTLEPFEQMPEQDAARYELKDGELVRMGTAKYGHEKTKYRVQHRLLTYRLENPIGEAHAEMAFAIRPERVCVPDISFLRNELLQRADDEHIFRGAPGLAIEVISENESALELRQKIPEYLEAGSKAVWAFYPNLRVVAVYNAAGVRELRGGQILEAPEILPGFQAPASEFFE
jgi:Uma2 family endonuclease